MNTLDLFECMKIEYYRMLLSNDLFKREVLWHG